MRSGRSRFQPGLLALEARLPLAGAGTGSTATPPAEQPILVGPTINPILSSYAEAYLSVRGKPNYSPAVDVNQNGIVGMEDALPILHSLAPITPKVPLTLYLTLAPGQQANTPHPANSGGVTRVPKQDSLTIIGHTTPNSLAFTDDANNDMRFKGGVAIPVDSHGNFYLTIQISTPYRISQHDFLVIDPFGHRLKRAFPILQLPS
jgi:hypothetical protein